MAHPNTIMKVDAFRRSYESCRFCLCVAQDLSLEECLFLRRDGSEMRSFPIDGSRFLQIRRSNFANEPSGLDNESADPPYSDAGNHRTNSFVEAELPEKMPRHAFCPSLCWIHTNVAVCDAAVPLFKSRRLHRSLIGVFSTHRPE